MGDSHKKNVLNEGYVILHDTMGSDLSVVNAARCSYARKSEVMDEKDERLIRYLAKHGHTSPFRHAVLQFEFKAPLMVARQHFKYIVGSSFQEATGDNMLAWNEESRRYVRDTPTFYIPDADEWRSYPDNIKQGSGDPLPSNVGKLFSEELEEYIEKGVELYENAIASGAAPEQARLFLPANGLYVRYYWTTSLQALAHFLKQRLADDSQAEIRQYAEAVKELALEKFPVSLKELLRN